MKILLGFGAALALVACTSTPPTAPLAGELVTQTSTQTLLHKDKRGSGARRAPRLVERTYFFGCLPDFAGKMSDRVEAATGVALQHSGYVLPGQFALQATRRGITGFTNSRAQASTGCMLRSANDKVITGDPLTVLKFTMRPEIAQELQAER